MESAAAGLPGRYGSWTAARKDRVDAPEEFGDEDSGVADPLQRARAGASGVCGARCVGRSERRLWSEVRRQERAARSFVGVDGSMRPMKTERLNALDKALP